MSPSLTFDNTLEVFERLSGTDGLVLIGGQALNYWCDRYRQRPTDLGSQGPVASKDVDFQSTRSTTALCASLLGGRYIRTSRRDMPAFLGAVVFTNSQGEEHTIDFLQNAYGLSFDQVERNAIPVQVESRPDLFIRVMHPVHCLMSRTHNVVGLPDKYAGAHGLRQLTASLFATREFIRELSLQNVRKPSQSTNRCSTSREQTPLSACALFEGSTSWTPYSQMIRSPPPSGLAAFRR